MIFFILLILLFSASTFSRMKSIQRKWVIKRLYDLTVQLSLFLAWVILQLCLFMVIRILICWCDFLACPQYGLACQTLNAWMALVAIPALYLAQVLKEAVLAGVPVMLSPSAPGSPPHAEQPRAVRLLQTLSMSSCF